MIRWPLTTRLQNCFSCFVWPPTEGGLCANVVDNSAPCINERKARVAQAFDDAIDGEPTLWVRAPGRVDLMGSHTDYNQGYVLTLSIGRETWLAARPRRDRTVACYSTTTRDGASFSLDAITRDADIPWTNYVRGVAQVLAGEGLPLCGFDAVIDSTIPIGRGLSSSAALEVAVAMAFKALGGWQIDPVKLALLCQRAENQFVGMSCGILDQYSSIMGRAGSAILLDCRDLSSRPVKVPAEIQVVICDTEARRELIGTEYTDRRNQCMAGARELAEFFPRVRYLRDVTSEQFAAHERDLPLLVARRCRFIIEENTRVLALAEALAAGDRQRICELTTASYAGACELYEIGAPSMAAMMAAMMNAPGVIGARQAGAGFGGCMVAFVECTQVEAFAASVLEAYRRTTGIIGRVYPVRPAAGAGVL